MQRHSLVAAALVLALSSAACSRLSFVKPSAKRGDSEQIAPRYEFRGTPESRQRSETRLQVARAARALRGGEVDAAERELRAALGDDPDNIDALTMLAVIESSRGRRQQAGELYARVAGLAPHLGGALENYGAWLCANGRPAEGMAHLDRAIAAPGYQDRASALAHAGACAEAAGQPERVERDLRAALQLQPANPTALSAMAQYQYRRGRFLEARAFSQRRLAAAPATAEVLLIASQIEDRLGDTAAAERYRQRLGREFPQALSAQPGESSRP
ncbi:type IV pilus biogenesis/stability protein PilW [Luteimonas sp. RD2P54]|uniref:Type IV pilus biogenesis/stability protein PilW n=1 Tax=Luteimonas endophytica TaxID=3042023 RepID=A0ABT6J3Q6_9GAMM|nr:type IV pilus biogenesis/stability protein PilW [Luteimonas endophytica]MDH5821457.1 type IV pilus biogenesis/stability protein PilW [Luteimonas endophytica]